MKYLKPEESKNPDNFLVEGDLLFTRLSGSLDFVGNCASVPPVSGMQIQYPDRLFCAKLTNPEHAGYLVRAFTSPIVRSMLTEGAKSSAGHQRISIGNITNQLVPLPTQEEQHEIVCRVSVLFDLADKIEQRAASALRRVESLTQSVLAKAFRGELVPTEAELARREGRSYETAAQLLERIQSEAGPKPGKKKVKK